MARREGLAELLILFDVGVKDLEQLGSGGGVHRDEGS